MDPHPNVPAQLRSARPARNRARAFALPLLALTAIVILATVVRVQDIVADPPGFYADEAAFGYNADRVLHTGRDEHGALLPIFFKSFGEYKLPVYIYSQIPLTALLGLSELSVRLTTATYGVLTVIAAFLLVRALFRDSALALLTAAIIAISPWHVFYSRTGLGDIVSHLFFLTAGLWLFVVGTKRPALWLAAGLSFLLALLSYRAAWVLTPPMLLVLLILYWHEISRYRWYALAGLFIVAIGGALIGWHLLSTSGDRAEDQWIIGLHLGLWGTFTRFLSQYGMHFTPGFLFSEERANFRHVVPGIGWLYWWQAPFILVGAAVLAYRPTRPKLLVLALALLYPLPAAATKASPESNRTILGALVFSIITAHGLLAVVKGFHRLTWPSFPKLELSLATLVVAATVVWAAIECASFLRTYHGSYKEQAGGFFGWQWGARQVVERMIARENSYDQVVFDGHGAFSEPHIFLRFYGCDRCVLGKWDEFGNPDKYDPKRKQLFAIQPDNYVLQYEYKKVESILNRDGDVAFILVEIVGRKGDPPSQDPQ